MSTGNIWIAIGIISSAIAAFSLPYGFYLKSHEKKTETVAEKPRIVAEKIENSGDIVGRDKVTYNQQIITPKVDSKQVDTEKIVKIKINRYLEDYKVDVEELKQEYFKESNNIASNMSSRGIGRSGIHIKAQMDNAIETKKKIDVLFTQLTRNIEDILLENFNAQRFSEVPNLQEEYNGYNSLQETNKKLHKAMRDNVQSWEVKINVSINITKDFTLE